MFPRPSLASFLATCLFALLLAGCATSLVPFTQELRVQHQLTAKDLQNLQFYVSHRVTLRRELSSGGSEITGNHTLLLVSGKTIEEVVIEERTPGIAIQVSDGSMQVSFEQGTSLTFSAASEPGVITPPPVTFAEPPEPFPGEPSIAQGPAPFPLESLAAFGGSYWIATGPAGQVAFQGKIFEAIEDTLKAHLLIDAESLEEVVQSRKVLSGVRLSDRP